MRKCVFESMEEKGFKLIRKGGEMKMKKHGFTLIELLVVVAIIAVYINRVAGSCSHHCNSCSDVATSTQ